MTPPKAPSASPFAPLPSASAFLDAPRKAVALFGMSGVGKTRLAQMLRRSGGWFHYSVDYRIGTRYMDEHIVDLFKREAMKSPLLREMLLSDSVRLDSNIGFENLAPLSTYLGYPGNTARGGLEFEEYLRRQRQHRHAELAAMSDAAAFMERGRDLYGYPHFLCDTSGSLVEIVDPDDATDPVLSALAPSMLFVYLRGSDAHEAELARRFAEDPKPIYYQETFLAALWRETVSDAGGDAEAVDPKAFARRGFARLLQSRAPRYQRIADNWGVAIDKERLAHVEDEAGFVHEIAAALAAKEAGRR